MASEGEPTESLLEKEYKSRVSPVFDSAKLAAQTYNVPAKTTVIATIRIVAITGLTASSSLIFLIFFTSLGFIDMLITTFL